MGALHDKNYACRFVLFYSYWSLVIQEYVPLLKILRDPEISQLHWDDDTLGMVEFDFIIDAGTTLRKIISVIFTSDNSEEH